MFDEYNRIKIQELKKLKSFFETCVQETHKTKAIAGQFGAGYSIFFGNAIQYNSFEIPFDAMRLIYEANKDRIDSILEQNSDLLT